MQPNEQPQPQPPVPQTPGAPANVPQEQPLAPAAQQMAEALSQPDPTPAVQPQQPASPLAQVDAVVPPEPEVVSDPSAGHQPTELPSLEPITWQSNEYAQHDKPPLWYIILSVVVLALMGIAIWLGAWSFAVLIPVMVVALMVYTHRPPQIINYAVSEQGLFINDTLHPMGEFRAFAVGQEMDHNSLMLIPIKRFRPAIKIFFPAEVGEQLVDLLGAYIPSQDYHVDAFDKIIQKLHI